MVYGTAFFRTLPYIQFRDEIDTAKKHYIHLL